MDRQTGLIEAEVFEYSTANTMHEFISDRVKTEAKIYTDTYMSLWDISMAEAIIRPTRWRTWSLGWRGNVTPI